MAQIEDNDGTIYQRPPGSRATVDGVIYVPNSDGVAVDETLLRLWHWADGRSLIGLHALHLFKDEPALAAKLSALRLAGLLLPPLTLPSVSPEVPKDPPLVSVVVVTHNGLSHLRECLPSLAAQTYPHLELIVVDDRSTDGTEAWVREHFPQVVYLCQPDGPNFAAACNLGVTQAAGEWLFMLNNDTVLEPTCVAELVAVGMRQTSVGGVAAMLRFYRNRAFVNGLGTYIPPHGYGYDLGIGSLDVGQFTSITEVPLLCFGAALISRSAWNQVGPLDTAYGFYYEDSDWSYRARRAGFTLLAASQARVYHKFSASLGVLPTPFKVRCVTRNRLRFVRKLLPHRVAGRRMLRYALEDGAHFMLYMLRRQPSLAWAIVRGWIEAVFQTPTIWSVRRRLPSICFAPAGLDALAAPFGLPRLKETIPYLTADSVEKSYKPHLGGEDTDGGRRLRLLIISPDVINVNMGGVGMRYWELAHVLAEHAQVTLATPSTTSLSADHFSLRVYASGRQETLRPLVNDADIVLVSGFIVYHHPFLRHLKQFVIVDLYDPTTLENLERFAARPLEEQQALYQVGVATYNDLFALGDFFICASEKQRDYWLGGLTSAGRTTPEVYAADPTLRRLIDVVPFGIQEQAPQHTQSVLKGVYPGIEADARVILWGGGLWDWLDPLTLIEAMPQVLAQIPQARLFFMGTQHPNPDVPPSRMATLTRARVAALGLEHFVFFNDWVEYAQRANYLLEADVGVSLHGDHIETRFAFRTRIMDYLWAGLPMVMSGGDVLSDWVSEVGLGYTVAPGDVDGVAQSLIALLQNPADRAQFAPLVEQFRWSQVARPLLQYITAPWHNGARTLSAAPSPTVPASALWRLPYKALQAIRAGGLTQLRRAVQEYLAWHLSSRRR